MASYGSLSTHSNDWKALQSVLQGVRWQSTFLDRLYRDSIPSIPGIYLVVIQPHLLSQRYLLPEHIAPVVYVGLTNDLRRRFLDHSTTSDRNKINGFREQFGTLRYVFSPVPKQLSQPDVWLIKAESALIRALDPPANSVIPTGHAIQGRIGPVTQLG